MNCSGSKVWSDLDSPALPDPAAFSLFRPGPSTSIMQTSQTLILSQYNFFFTIPSSPLGSKLWDPKNAVSKWAISALHHGLSIWVRCKCVNDPGQHWTQSPVSRPRCRHWWFILSILFCTITQTINEREREKREDISHLNLVRALHLGAAVDMDCCSISWSRWSHLG